MTFHRSSQLVLVSAAALAAAALISACGTLTTDFVFVASARAAGPNNYGEIDVFEINSNSGRMRQIPTSPFPSGGRNPVAEAISPDSQDLYVVNQDDNTIVQFVIGHDGKVYPQNTLNTQGIFPMAVATGGSFLFVADTYQPLPDCSSAKPCSGSVAVYPILTEAQAAALTPPQPPDTLGAPAMNRAISAAYWPLTLAGPNSGHVLTPTAVTTASAGGALYLYVTAYDATATPNLGYVFGFVVGSDGTLSALLNSPWQVGGHPAGITASSDGSVVYVTDANAGNVHVFTTLTGELTEIGGSPFATGNQPGAVVVDGTGKYLFVANAGDSTLAVFSSSGGVLTSLGTYPTGLQPIAIGVDPSLNEYVYTANFLGNTVSGFQLNASNGNLLNSQYSPSGTNANPTAVAAIPHSKAGKP